MAKNHWILPAHWNVTSKVDFTLVCFLSQQQSPCKPERSQRTCSRLVLQPDSAQVWSDGICVLIVGGRWEVPHETHQLNERPLLVLVGRQERHSSQGNWWQWLRRREGRGLTPLLVFTLPYHTPLSSPSTWDAKLVWKMCQSASFPGAILLKFSWVKHSPSP